MTKFGIGHTVYLDCGARVGLKSNGHALVDVISRYARSDMLRQNRMLRQDLGTGEEKMLNGGIQLKSNLMKLDNSRNCCAELWK